jgi:hypothetical protein
LVGTQTVLLGQGAILKPQGRSDELGAAATNVERPKARAGRRFDRSIVS